MIRNNSRVARFLAVTYLIVLIVLSLIPSASSATFTWADKLVHIVLYATLAFMLEWSGWFRSKLIIIFLALSYGISMEFLQHLTPYRMFDWWDVLANTIGVLIWLSISQLLSKRKYEK